MRILSCYVNLPAYRDRIMMLERLGAAKGRVDLITSSVPDGWSATPTNAPHFQIHPVARQPIRRQRLQWKLLATALELMGAGDPIDVVHDTRGFLLPLFAYLRLRRDRPALVATSFQGSAEWLALFRRKPYLSPPYLRLKAQGLASEQAMARLADSMLVLAEGHRAPTARLHRIPLDHVGHVPNCVDPARFHPGARLQRELPAGGRPLLLFVGNLFRYKGVFELLDAVRRLRSRWPDLHLLLVGGEAHTKEARRIRAILEMRNLSGNVSILGTLPNEHLPGVLNACDLFVFPSWNEGCPRAVIEAMACGRPIVATTISGVETLDPGRDFIRFVQPDDPAALAEAIAAALTAAPADTLARSEACRRRFLSHHTPEVAAAARGALFETLSARPAARGARRSGGG